MRESFFPEKSNKPHIALSPRSNGDDHTSEESDGPGALLRLVSSLLSP